MPATLEQLVEIANSYGGSFDDEQSYHVNLFKTHELFQSPKKILVVGCCGDVTAEWLSSLGHEVTGCDFRPYTLSQWEEPTPPREPNFNFIQGDFAVAELPENYFDIAIAISSIEHFGLTRWGDPKDPDGDLKASHKVHVALKDGGTFFISVPFQGGPFGERPDVVNGTAHRVYSEESLRVLLDGFLEIHRGMGREILLEVVKVPMFETRVGVATQ